MDARGADSAMPGSPGAGGALGSTMRSGLNSSHAPSDADGHGGSSKASTVGGGGAGASPSVRPLRKCLELQGTGPITQVLMQHSGRRLAVLARGPGGGRLVTVDTKTLTVARECLGVVAKRMPLRPAFSPGEQACCRSASCFRT